jgi:hypothetical protein
MRKSVAIIIHRLAGDGAERVVSNLSLSLNDSIQRFIIINDNENVIYPYKGELICTNTKAAVCFTGKLAVFIKRLYSINKIKRNYKPSMRFSYETKIGI